MVKEEINKQYKEEYRKLMESIKDEEPFLTIDISGMGSGYERACQLALRAGLKWLTERLRQLLGDEALRTEMGRQARQYVVDNFSYPVCLDTYLDYFNLYLER